MNFILFMIGLLLLLLAVVGFFAGKGLNGLGAVVLIVGLILVIVFFPTSWKFWEKKELSNEDALFRSFLAIEMAKDLEEAAKTKEEKTQAKTEEATEAKTQSTTVSPEFKEALVGDDLRLHPEEPLPCDNVLMLRAEYISKKLQGTGFEMTPDDVMTMTWAFARGLIIGIDEEDLTGYYDPNIPESARAGKGYLDLLWEAEKKFPAEEE